MKLRSDSTLASLTEDQRDQLYDWLSSASYAEVIALAAKPLADGGFNLKLHRTTLARFLEHEQRERQARELAELAAAADNADTPAQIESLIRATRERFTRAAYELAKSAASDRADFDRLQRALHSMDLIQVRREDLELKKKELVLEEIRIAEQRRQWEFDAAREVMKNFVAYEKIHRRRDINEHAKIWKARDVAFGKSPTGQSATVQPDNLRPDNPQTSPVLASPARTPQPSEPPRSGPTHSDTLLHVNSSAPTPLSPLPAAERSEIPASRDSKSVDNASACYASSAVQPSSFDLPPCQNGVTHSATPLHDNSNSPAPLSPSSPVKQDSCKSPSKL